MNLEDELYEHMNLGSKPYHNKIYNHIIKKFKIFFKVVRTYLIFFWGKYKLLQPYWGTNYKTKDAHSL